MDNFRWLENICFGVYNIYFYFFSDFYWYNNDIDLGMKSGIGLKFLRILIREFRFLEISKLG